MSTQVKINGILSCETGLLTTGISQLTSGDFAHFLIKNVGTGNIYVGPSGATNWPMSITETLEIDLLNPLFGNCSGAGTASYVLLRIT